jgi:TldD protein
MQMKNLLKTVIEKGKEECDYLEIRIEENEQLQIIYSGALLEEASKNLEKGGFVRALYHGGWGEVSFNNLENLEEHVATAIKQARMVGKGESKFAKVPVVEDRVLLELIKDPREMCFEDKINLFKGYNDLVLSFNEDIKSSSIRYLEKFTYLTFANSEGSYIYQEKLDLSGGVSAIAVRSGNTQTASTSFGSTNDFGVALNIEHKIKDSCQRAVDLLSAKKVKAGQYPVIINPDMTGLFIHEAFGHLSEADDTADNDTLKELMTLGKQVANSNFNVYDSGTVKGTRGYLCYDDEGVKTEKTYLIKDGKLCGRLHSRESAAKMGELPTGSARALSYKFPPICRMRATSVEAGDASLEDMLKGIELGLIAYGGKGGETNGEMFTFSAQYAYMIRQGKIAELVRDINLTGNVFTTLKNIDMLGNEETLHDGPGGCGKGYQSPLPITDGGPYMRIQNVVVGGDE